MDLVSFASDYLEGAQEKVLEALIKTNMVQQPGYGDDAYSVSAKAKIKEACACPDGEVYFLNGGTQTNQILIDTMLAPYEGVLAATTGHVAVHEAGAIEYTGHKVLTLPAHDGKVDADEMRAYVETFYGDGSHEHMVFPGMLYISHPTEYGTLYTADELQKISATCHEYGIRLFLDGARLGYGLMVPGTDVTLQLLAELCDVFYIGGTKVGALCGEAVVFPHKEAMPKHFVTQVKQHGALLAKGRLVGVQFDALFTDNLYFEISRHAIEMAMQVKAICAEAGLQFYLDSPTNQQFVIMENSKLEKLAQSVQYGFWEKYDDTHTVIRFATSWATQPASLDVLREALKKL